MKPRLVFFLGGAGAGKTTAAKALAARRRAAVFDMDTLLRPAAEALMTLAGLDPSDRDSDAYKQLCRDLGYRITMDAALENIAVGTDAFVIGPFTRETDDPDWLDRELSRFGVTRETAFVKVVFVTLADPELYRTRIRLRGSELDRWKLDNWSAFSRSLAPREQKWGLPGEAVLRFDNSGPLDEAKLAQLETFVYGDGE
ncbi:AAA family ATPase [Paenibacillus humicola]|uniref:AAA family ATPase n=1 Tax=Paenibacillus humicola TaxID=3110540 RepID=UPI00237A8A77|nr:AAA family ATPase [Paenibacillus humicola]